MTCIAFDGRYVAADTMEIGGGSIKPMRGQKIIIREGVIFTGPGVCNWFEAWIAWVLGDPEQDLKPEDPSRIPAHGFTEAQGGLVVIRDGIASACDWQCPYLYPSGTPWAWGSGADYALGAMGCGASAMRGVQQAIRWDVNCGGEVDFVDVQNLAAGVRPWLP